MAPVSRVSIFLGKMLGASTDSIIQGTIVLMLGFLIGITISLQLISKTIPLMFLITVDLVCIGLTLASFMESLESFGSIMTFVNLPMFFLSGALFPVRDLPSWLQWVIYINPLTYDVDALRTIILGNAYVSHFPFYVDLIAIIHFRCYYDIRGHVCF